MPSTLSQDLAAAAKRELLENILPFWRRYAPDRQYGGFIAELSNALEQNPRAAKGLILNARILWTFSAVWRLTRAPEDATLAKRAFDYLNDRFYDSEFGGYFWELDPTGKPVNRTKKIYGQGFALYAVTEFYRSFGQAAALDSAVALMRRIEQFGRDQHHGGYWETLSPDWQPCDDVRLSDKDLNEKKSMNNHLHILEAYTNLVRVWPDPLLKQRLRELIVLFLDRILDPSKCHFHHFFDETWAPRSHSYTYGHDIEGSWLLCEAASLLDDEPLRHSTISAALRIARSTFSEGLDSDGGLFYEGQDNVVINTTKEWWPQAEAVVGFLNAWQLSEDACLLEAANKCWAFIQNKIVDHSFGEWFWAVNRDGVPDQTLPKLSMWKCPYHNSRACLEILARTSPLPLSKP